MASRYVVLIVEIGCLGAVFGPTSVGVGGCNQHDTALTGKACLGANSDTLVESIKNQCQAGDIVGTKHPAYFCDFTYSVAYNDFNSAFCVYNGKVREERVQVN